MILPYMLRVYGIVYAVDWVELYFPWPILLYISLADSIIYFPGRLYYLFFLTDSIIYFPWPIILYISLADSIIYFPGRFCYIIPWPILLYISLAGYIIYFPGRFYYIFSLTDSIIYFL